MKGFLTALTFLTIVKFDVKDSKPENAGDWFPIVGVLLGIPLIFLIKISHMGAIFSLVYLIVITGGLHIDGLSDTADGLFSHRSRERKLEIMKDSHIGVMGMITVLIVILSKNESLKLITATNIFLIPSYGRLMALLIMKKLPYARREGTGGYFKEQNKLRYSNFLIFVPVVLSVFSGFYNFILINMVFFILYIFILEFYKKIIGGWTGDMLGASIEVTETVLFVLWTFF